jgi:hypothetical protein
MDAWLDAAGRQQRGLVGHAEARLARARDIVAVAVDQLRQDETVFLHPPGVDGECDEARGGWRLGRLRDPYGHRWEIGHPLEPGENGQAR